MFVLGTGSVLHRSRFLGTWTLWLAENDWAQYHSSWNYIFFTYSTVEECGFLVYFVCLWKGRFFLNLAYLILTSGLSFRDSRKNLILSTSFYSCSESGCSHSPSMCFSTGNLTTFNDANYLIQVNWKLYLKKDLELIA